MDLEKWPKDYRWSAPFIITEIRDEPDRAQGSVLAIYDYSMGRLGSDIRLHVAGSDDSTNHRLVVRTEVVVELVEHLDVIGAIVALATYRCQEVTPELISESEEYGPSDLRFDWISRPYAFIADQAHGQPATVPQPLHSASATGEDGLFSDGEINKNDGFIPKPGEDTHRRFLFNDVVPTTPIRLVVGIENELKAYTNDWTYTIRLRSHWLLTSVKIGVT